MTYYGMKSTLLKQRQGIVIKTWVNNFVGFFTLIGNRKTTETHGLLPSSYVICTIALCVIIPVTFAHFFADLLYMEWFKVNNTDDPTSIYTKTTDLAQVDWYLISAGVVMLLISFVKLKPKSNIELVKWHHWFTGVYFIFTSIAFSGLITLLLKNIFGRVRPNFYDGINLWQSFPFQGEYDFLSFPSGHSTTAGAIAMIIYLFAPKVTPIAILFAVWIAISRLGVGAHYPADVIAGLAVGAIFTWVYARSFARKRLLFCFDSKGKLAFRKPYCSC